ncbi:DUF3667 domain-containing protein [Hymenobacter sp. ASUV-10]|uniref:DUF3667 domain-containing protein n=1 Tax=Hymenobacter aranciens TaxID=3063996 RepID=A0ABT9BDM5_9BACT|nr:DUF3667 domain-containing protein [Hymenobacter sp. ASUV-10]MDO7876364.1 DUF3667 domain-containing protein [Hymenobacter sp. ASUV-10]
MAHHAAHKQPACANCHYQFEPARPDEFCPRCGQQNHAIDLRVGHVVEEFLEGVFHFDGKVFSTARLLLFKPGELTRRFLAGHRVPYVPPIRLYVFISFVFFLLLGWVAGHSTDEGTAHARPVRRGFVYNMNTDSLTARPAKQPFFSINIGGDSLDSGAGYRVPLSNDSVLRARDLARLPDHASSRQVDSLIRSKGATPTYFSRLRVSRYLRWRNASPDETAHVAIRTASILLFLLMPLAALLLQATYRRQRRYYLGHLIFTIHLHCVLFVLLMLGLLTDELGLTSVSTWLPLLILPYFVLALRRVYEQGWGKTLLKATLLALAYLLLLVLGTLLGTVLGVVIF